MALKIRVVLLALIAVLASRTTDSCYFYEPPTLQFEVRPDAPVSLYAAGRLGILMPGFARSHLVVAYRYLSGRPLDAKERIGVAELMKSRIDDDRDYSHPWPLSPSQCWIADRALAVPDAEQVEVSEWGEGAFSHCCGFLNCTQDAFSNAINRLQQHVRTFGAGSAAVRSWVAAQDVVFANCSQPKGLPDEADATLPEVIRKDRQYQIAAAALYGMDFDRAHALFRKIAADDSSPWANLSAYLAVRSLVRKSTLGVDADVLTYAYLQEPMEQAAREVRGIIDAPRYASLRPDAQRLENFILVRTQPQQYLERLAQTLMNGTSPGTMRDDLADYTLLLDRDLTSGDDLTRWIRTFQAEPKNDDDRRDPARVARSAYDEALAEWQTSHRTPWLIAALVHANADSPSVDAVLQAADKVEVTSPAFVTAAYQRIRLLRGLHRDAEWQRDVSRVLALDETILPASSRNVFRQIRLPLAASLDAFLADAPRTVVGYGLTGTSKHDRYTGREEAFDEDAAAAINQTLPLTLLASAAQGKRLPPLLQRMVIIAAWTRAVLLGHDDVAVRLTPILQASEEELREPLERYRVASADDRPFEATSILVRFSGLTPYVGAMDARLFSRRWPRETLADVPHDQYTHENWWCVDGITYGQARFPQHYPPTVGIAPRFAVGETTQREAAAERTRLKDAGAGSTVVLKRVVAWARSRPGDPRIPEALSRAIKTTQWSCPDGETGAAARSAFNLLHTRYRNSEAAKKTRYWFTGEN